MLDMLALNSTFAKETTMFSIHEVIHEVEVAGRRLRLDFGAVLPESVSEGASITTKDIVTGENVTVHHVHAADDASKVHLQVRDAETGEGVHVVFNRQGGILSEHAVGGWQGEERVNPLPEEAPVEEAWDEDSNKPKIKSKKKIGFEQGTNIPRRHEAESQA